MPLPQLTPASPDATPSTQDSTPKDRSKAPAIIAVIILLVVIAGGAAFAYTQKWISLPGEVSNTPPTLGDVVKAGMTMTSASVTTRVDFATEPFQASTTVIGIPPEIPGSASNTALLRLSALTSSLQSGASAQHASDVHVTAEIGSKYRAGDHSSSDTTLKGTYTSNGFSLTLDMAARSIGDDVYLKMSTLPIPFIDSAAIKDTWIHLSKNGSTNVLALRDPSTVVWASSSTASAPTSTFADDLTAFTDEFKILREELVGHGVFTVSDAKRTTGPDGKDRWDLTIALHPEGFRAAVVAAVARRPSTTPKLLTDGFKDYVDRDEFVSWMTNALHAIQMHVLVDAASKIPVGETVEMRYAVADKDGKPGPDQYHLSLSYAFADINAPVTITAPDSPIELMQAIRKMLHVTDEQARIDDQVSIIDDLRNALAFYRRSNGTFPANLSDLIGVDNTFQKVVAVPSDQFTGKPFDYHPIGKDDYALQYQIQLPADTSTLTYTEREVVQGTNTANALERSAEAATTIDTDGDGLPDAVERKLGTSIYLKDTDGDGFTDKEEVDSGHDPLVKGK